LLFEKAFTITVTNVNETPTDISLSNSSVAENAAVNTVVGTLSTTDPDSSNTFTYTLVAGTGDTDNASFNISGSSLRSSASFDFESKNSYSVRIRTTDQGGLLFEKAFTITVTNVNEAPVAENGSAGTNEDTPVAITLVASDVDDDTLSFEVVDQPAHGTLSGTAPALTYTPSANYNGTDSFTFKASDSLLYSNTATVDITIAAMNDAPVAENASIGTNEDTQATITLVASDVDGDALIFAVIAQPVHGTLFGSAPNLKYRPDPNYNGSDAITFLVSDGKLASNVATLTINVLSVNDAPVITSNGGGATADISMAENDADVTTVAATDVDAETTLTYSLSEGADMEKFSIDAASGELTFKTAPDFDIPGDADGDNIYIVTVQVSDGVLSDSQTLSIFITGLNETPTDIILLSATQLLENQPIGTNAGSLDTTDPDTAESFTYSLVNGGPTCPGTQNENFDIVSNLVKTARIFDFEMAADKTHAVCIQTQDSSGLILQKAFIIRVGDANDIPVVHAFLPDQDGQTGTVFSFIFAVDTFTDQDPGDELIYSATLRNGSGLPAWLSFDPAQRLFSGTPLVGDEGTRFIRVTANDGQGGTVFDDFALSITAPSNIGPIQNYPIPDQVILVGSVFNYTVPEATFVDPDSTQPLIYEADLAGGAPLPSWLTFNPATRTFLGFPGMDIVAPLDLRVTVFDAGGKHVSGLFNLSFVSETVPTPPFLMQPLTDQNAITGTEFEVVFDIDTFHDPQSSPLTYTATTDSGLSLPDWLRFDGATRTFSGLPTEGDVGTFLVRVTAENVSGLTADGIFRIAVSKAVRDVLYRVLLPAGSRENSNVGQVNIPSGIVEQGSHSYFYELTGLSTTSTPDGYSWLSPVVELGIFNGNDQPIINFSSPVEVCFNPSASQRMDHSSEDFAIGSSQDGGLSWTLLPTYLNSSNNMFCTTVSHFSLFTVFTRILPKILPITGFAPDVTTTLPDYREFKPVQSLGDLWIEIPSIRVQETVVGVFPQEDGWDLSWLGNSIGWLNTTAFPSWSGNSVLTAHLIGSDGKPGPFYDLHLLSYGDRIIVHLNNQKYIYEVRSIDLNTDPEDTWVFRHEDYPWITLVTCRNFDPETNTYLLRTVVGAIQVEISGN